MAGLDALVVRVNVTRESNEAVVKSSANLGSTRSVAVNPKEGVIILALERNLKCFGCARVITNFKLTVGIRPNLYVSC